MQGSTISFAGICFLLLLAGCSSNPFPQGERLYAYHCGNCHMPDGSGLEGLIPPLAQSDFLRQYPEQIPCIIRHGLKGTVVVNGKTYAQEMAAIADLNHFEITNIINYIHFAWGNDLEYRTVPEVQAALENCTPLPSSEK
ncbi:MAG: c-type cytochrome [Saprospirales bacterium]|nr:c-type cytochrome [Saprospirales bacterium]